MRTRITRFALALALLGSWGLRPAQAQTVYVPATVTGYNADVIAENTPVASYTTNTVDRGIPTVKWCFANSNFPGLTTANSLPVSGLITSISTAGLTFQMAPATGNNSLRIAGNNINNPGVLTLTNPQPCSEVMILATEGNGTTAADKNFVVYFTDGSSQPFNSVVVPDWFNGIITPAINVGSRVSYVTNAIDITPNNPRLYEVRLNLSVSNYSKSVQRIEVSKSADDPVLNVMGVSLGSNCLGVPTGGTATASALSVCPGSPVALALVNASATGGITYQWQGSTDGGATYSNIPGATTILYTVRPTVSTQYRAVVTCRLQSSNSSVVAVTVLPTTATVAYAAAGQSTTFCGTGSAPVVTVSPTGGTFSSTPGLALNATTGTVDLTASTPGTYVVTYTVPNACQAVGTAPITVLRPVATLAYNTAPYCRSGANPVPVLSLPGGTFSSTTGLAISPSTGVIDVRASQPGTYRVTYVSGGQCPATATANVTLVDNAATLAYAAPSFCRTGTSGTPTATPVGGTFSAPGGLAVNPATGIIDLANSTAGTYTVTYSNGGPCPTTATTQVVVKSDALPTFPNVITPNNDKVNDALILKISDVTGYRMQVYSRWGRKVYDGSDPTKGWDAADNSAGMYYYQVSYTDCAGRLREYKSWIEVVK